MTAEIVRIQLRRGTAAQWTANNPTLAISEFGIETDTGKFKIGDGDNEWVDLDYFTPGSFSDYLTTTNAASTYLTQANAASTYLTQSNASSTYLTQTNAGTTYAAKAGVTFTGSVVLAADPTVALGAATKQYVDDTVAGLTWKEAVHLLATSNIALSGNHGTVTIDSHAALTSAEDGYRLLLTGQSTASENGIYDYNDDGDGTYTLTRSADSDTVAELQKSTVLVLEGTLYGGTSWVQSDYSLSDFANQDWVQFNTSTVYTAGTGLVLNNSTEFALDADLNDLGDAVITSATTNDALVYNGTSWVNAPIVPITVNSSFSYLRSPLLGSPQEAVIYSASALNTGNTTVDASKSDGLRASVFIDSASKTTQYASNYTFTFTNVSSTLGSVDSGTAKSITYTMIPWHGAATTGGVSGIVIDGTTYTNIYWNGGVAPVGSASALNVYTFTIIKTANTPSFTILGTHAAFATV